MSHRLTVYQADTSNPLATLVEDYLDSCRARGLSKNTVDQSYGYSLRHVFLPWCNDQGITDVQTLTQRVLDRYTSTLLQRGGVNGELSTASVHSYVRPVRQLLAWAVREGELASDARPQLPRLPRKVLDVLTREEINRLEDAATNDRDRLIIRLLADTGMRASELCRLRPSHATRHHGGALLRLEGKGAKQRLVPISPKVARRLDHFNRRRCADAPDEVFYALRRDRDGTFRPLTRNGVLQMLRCATDRAGISKRVYSHLLRHSFATEALRCGMGPVQLANVLGHSGLRMIEQTYSHLNANDSYEAVLRVVADR